jgi:ferredoxin
MRKDFLQSMSRRQHAWSMTGFCLMAVILSTGLIQEIHIPRKRPPALSMDMTIKQIAPRLGVTGKSLARELGLPLDVNKNKPLKETGIHRKTFEHVAKHLLGHRSSPLKYYLFAIFVLWGWLFLARIGRPDNMELKQRRRWYPKACYLIPLILSVTVAGFLLGKSPNPMEGAVKVFKSMVGLYPDVWKKIAAFAFFFLLGVVGNKLICGWACPFGALQELIYTLPFFKKIKPHKLPFAVTNTIRGTLFLSMLLILFGVVGSKKGFVIYHYINPFNLFNLDFETASSLITVIAAIGVGLFFYRPFCQFICPFGLLSWMVERLSLYRVTVDTEACTHCGACVKACPLPAMEGRLEEKQFPADCFSCGRCLNACPVDAIRYESVLKSSPKG